MTTKLISYVAGIVFPVEYPKYGYQDLGVSPQGPADLIAFRSGHILLGSPESFEAYEIVAKPQKIEFYADIIFVIVGSEYANCTLTNSTGVTVKLSHATVYQASCGDILQLSGSRIGFRTYLISTLLNNANKRFIGASRGIFEHDLSQFSNVINVTKGPEYDYLLQPQDFLTTSWQISSQSDNMGIRLIGNECTLKQYDILSSIVCPGVIQFSKNEPIILMQQCQTIGGYPRGFVVTQESLCNLAQLQPQQFIRFNLISITEAKKKRQLIQSVFTEFSKYING